MEQIVKCETGSGGFISLVSAALEEQSLSVSVVWQLLLAVREAELPLNVLMEEIQKEPGAELFFQAGNALSLLCTFPTAGRMYFLTPSSPLLQASQTLSHSFLWCLEILFSGVCPKPVSFLKQSIGYVLEKHFPHKCHCFVCGSVCYKGYKVLL